MNTLLELLEVLDDFEDVRWDEVHHDVQLRLLWVGSFGLVTEVGMLYFYDVLMVHFLVNLKFS